MTELRTILVVDDDAAMCEMVISMLEEAGFAATSTASAEAAIDKLRSEDFGAVLSDVRMPSKDGMELLGEVRELRPDTPVILMTAFGSIDTAVEAMAAGAFHYITKPFKRKEVTLSLERALQHRAVAEENRRLRLALGHSTRLENLIGESPATREILAVVSKVASSRSTVLLTGESGTGRESIARAIHFSGTRAEHTFLPFHCTAVPEEKLESELFGRERGDAPNLAATTRGLFEQAGDGTLFLGEIDAIPLALQGKLLRALEDQAISRVGGEERIPISARLIAAASRDLRKLVEAGSFRRDLYFRLNVIPIDIPPLRERPEDIRPLAQALLRKHAGESPVQLSEEALRKLEMGSFEGNAHELENLIERALAMATESTIGPEELSVIQATARTNERIEGDLLEGALAHKMSLSEFEDRYIAEILELTRGNKAKAAEILGVNRRTLYRRSAAIERVQKETGKYPNQKN